MHPTRPERPLRQGDVWRDPHFTGLDSPYEPPQDPEVRLYTIGQSVEALADELVGALQARGLIG